MSSGSVIKNMKRTNRDRNGKSDRMNRKEKISTYLDSSVTRWLNYLFSIGQLTTMKIYPI